MPTILKGNLWTFDRHKTKLKAGRIFFHQLDSLIADNQPFILETTLAGKYLKKILENIKARNYKIKMLYIFLESPETCIQRIDGRVKKGGHFIPNADVIRRYYRSKNNFWKTYTALSTNWQLYFNGTSDAQRVAIGKGAHYDVENNALFELFLKDMTPWN